MFTKILVPVDLDDLDHQLRAIAAARTIAVADKRPLALLSVVQRLGNYASTFFPKDFERRASADALQRLQTLAERELTGLSVETIVAHGAIYDEILSTQQRIGADLIVMASHRPELQDYLLGPNAARVVRHAPCSVMVIRD